MLDDIDRVLISEEILRKATNDLYVIGDGSVISPLDYGFEIVNNVPTNYIKVFENVRATGYYAPYGAGTATGRLAQVGYVAVDPKIIPYGSSIPRMRPIPMWIPTGPAGSAGSTDAPQIPPAWWAAYR